MTKKAEKKPSAKGRIKSIKLAEIQQDYLAITDPKLLKRRAKKAQDYNLTLFAPRENVSLRDVGDKQLVFVRDGFGGKYGKWRPFHNATPAVEKLQSLPYIGLNAPLSAWHGVSLAVANRILAADLPGGRDYKPSKQDATTAAFVAGRKKGKAA